jgi:predicted nucleic acid-binding protein
MRVYLDNCSFNRPFDDQSQPRIRLETEAKLCIQDSVQAGTLELAWSYVLDFENTANPFDDRRIAIDRWKGQATVDVGETDELLQTAKELASLGLKSKDALHLACAMASRADYFVTTDDRILNRNAEVHGIEIVDPTVLVRRLNP